jgi:hypothetical protein
MAMAATSASPEQHAGNLTMRTCRNNPNKDQFADAEIS